MDFIELAHDRHIVTIELRRISSARRYTLRIHNGHRRAIITMPLRGSKQTALDLAERNAAWIAARIDKIPDAIPFSPDVEIWFKGAPHILCHHPDQKGAAWAEPAASSAQHGFIHIGGERPHFERRLREFLKKSAHHELQSSVDFYCAELNLPTRHINIRDPKSRWGSCSSDGRLNFSWRLIMAPDYVLDYLAAHEVCHLIHLNHSADFWALTRRLCPMTNQADHWLKYSGTQLYRFGEGA